MINSSRLARGGHLCSECQKPAQTFCQQEKMFFCLPCDQAWHNQEQLQKIEHQAKTLKLDGLGDSSQMEQHSLDNLDESRLKLHRHQRLTLDDY
jgi:hypothetical protein